MAALWLAILAALLVAVDIGLVLGNQSTAATVAARRDAIARTPQLAKAVQVVATSLAQAAVQNDDPALRTLLNSNGIAISVNAPAPLASTQPMPARSP